MQTADCVFVVALDFSICFHLCFKVCSSCCPIGCELGSGENDIFVFVGGGFSGPYLFTPREVHGRERQLGDVRGLSLDATWGVLVKWCPVCNSKHCNQYQPCSSTLQFCIPPSFRFASIQMMSLCTSCTRLYSSLSGSPIVCINSILARFHIAPSRVEDVLYRVSSDRAMDPSVHFPSTAGLLHVNPSFLRVGVNVVDSSRLLRWNRHFFDMRWISYARMDTVLGDMFCPILNHNSYR